MRASAMEDENENLDIQVEVLPLDMTIRENEIQKLQIELMAGKRAGSLCADCSYGDVNSGT